MFKNKQSIDSIFGADEYIADMVISICATMFDNGLRIVHVGGLMRMLGIANEIACEHDEQAIQLPDDFYEQLAQLEAEEEFRSGNNITIH